MVPPYSHGIPRVPRYSGYHAPTSVFEYWTITIFGLPSHAVPLTSVVLKVVRTPRILLSLVWPLPRSLATTSGISVDFFSSPYLDVSVQVVTFIQLCIHCMMTGLIQPGFPIRKSTDRCLLSTPRGLSQIAASFVGSWCQGILLAPFVA